MTIVAADAIYIAETDEQPIFLTKPPLMLLRPTRLRPMIQQSAKVDEPARFFSQGKANDPMRPLIVMMRTQELTKMMSSLQPIMRIKRPTWPMK